MDEESLRQQISTQIRAEYETKLRELKRLKNLAEEEHENATDAWRAERRQFRAEIDRLEDELAQRWQAGASGGGKPQQALEDKYRQAELEWESERERLKAELIRVQTALTEVVERPGNKDQVLEESAGPVPPADMGAIDAELTRVDAAIRAIEKLFDDPNTTASMMARKNAERAELEAYLQGILFLKKME